MTFALSPVGRPLLTHFRYAQNREQGGFCCISILTVYDFILKVSVPKVTEKLVENRDGEVEKLVENVDKLIEKLVEKATGNGDKLTENRIAILRLIAGNPYISQSELAESIGISITAIGNNIKVMRNKYLRRVGPDKGGFWEIIE